LNVLRFHAGGMWILKNIVHKLTCVLHEQQNKLATFKVIAGKKVDNEPHILDLCDIYHELLKEMSCELGSFHHELQFGISKVYFYVTVSECHTT